MSAPTGPILARWDGRCPECGDRIDRGDLIIQIAGVWLHSICAVGVEAAAAASGASSADRSSASERSAATPLDQANPARQRQSDVNPGAK